MNDKLEKMQEELDFIKGIEKSVEKDYQDLKKRYDEQMRDSEKWD